MMRPRELRLFAWPGLGHGEPTAPLRWKEVRPAPEPLRYTSSSFCPPFQSGRKLSTDLAARFHLFTPRPTRRIANQRSRRDLCPQDAGLPLWSVLSVLTAITEECSDNFSDNISQANNVVIFRQTDKPKNWLRRSGCVPGVYSKSHSIPFRSGKSDRGRFSETQKDCSL